MLPPREEVEGKIRAMRAAGHPDHQIGYAIGWDFGQIKGRADQNRYWEQTLATKDRLHQQEIHRLKRQWFFQEALLREQIAAMQKLAALDAKAGTGGRSVMAAVFAFLGFLAGSVLV